VQVGERFLQVFHDLVFGLDIGRAVFAVAQLDRGLGAENSRADQVIDGGDVLDLGAKVAHALELALRGGEGKLVGGHGFSSRNQFVLSTRELAVEDGSDGGLGGGKGHAGQAQAEQETAHSDATFH
jgi:hypothetical protein